MHSHDLLILILLHTVLSPYFLSLPIVSPNPFTDGSVKLLPLCLVLRLAVFKSFLINFFNIVIALKPLSSFMAKTIWKIKKRRRNFVFFCLFVYYLWGQKVLEALAHSIPSPRPMPRRKKCPGTNEGNPNCQNVLPRTTLSSANQNHERKKCHITRGHPLEDHKRDSKPYGLAIGE